MRPLAKITKGFEVTYAPIDEIELCWPDRQAAYMAHPWKSRKSIYMNML
jgi:hypothetical protein